MRLIFLTKNEFCLVDDEDYASLSVNKWTLAQCGNRIKKLYAKRCTKKTIDGVKKCTQHYMHRQILGEIPKGMTVDHINGNGLDNRKINLRICTRSENLMNSKKANRKTFSKYKGVTYFNRKGLNKRWCARLGCRENPRSLGYYLTEKEAAAAYNKAALEFYGEFANLNNLEGK